MEHDPWCEGAQGGEEEGEVGSGRVVSPFCRLVFTQGEAVNLVNPTTTLIPPSPAPRTRWQDPTAIIFTHSYAGWSGVPWCPCPPVRLKHEPHHIYRHTNWHVTRCRWQHPKSHRDTKNECAQTWPLSMARILGGDAAPWMSLEEELWHCSLS